MSDKWHFFTELPPKWAAVCGTHRSTLHTEAWQVLLARSFNTVPLYALGPEDTEAFALTLFPARPFWVGYIGFPAGGMAGVRPITHMLVKQMMTADLPRTVHLLKLVTSPFPELLLLDYPYAETWETIIPDLSTWQKNQLSSRVRRDIRKAQKCNVVIEDADQAAAAFIFHLYQETIHRHRGTTRYSRNYFQHLLELTQEMPDLRCWLATTENQPIAFLTAVREGETVFYLHGAIDRNYRKYQASDLLVFSAIEWAKNEGAKNFNMMASPLSQPSLVKYKEKWGGVTEKQRTYDLPIRPAAAYLFQWLLKGYNLLGRS